MELFDIKSKVQLDELVPLLKDAGMSDQIIWTSGTDLGSEGHFYWSSTGEDFTSSVPWRIIPNNMNDNEHCVELFYEKELNDIDCNTRHSYICYVNETVVEESKKYEQIENETVYLIDYQKLNWYMAEKNCKNNKMNLLTVKDDIDTVKKVMIGANITKSSLWLSDLSFMSKDALMFGNNIEIPKRDNTVERSDGYIENCAFLRNYNGVLYQDDKNCFDQHFFICVGSLKNDIKSIGVQLESFLMINLFTVIIVLII